MFFYLSDFKISSINLGQLFGKALEFILIMASWEPVATFKFLLNKRKLYQRFSPAFKHSRRI